MVSDQTLAMWRNQGFSQEQIDKMSLVLGSPEACKVAMDTGDFDKAYEIVKAEQEIKEDITIDYWFSQFCKESPADADELSRLMSKFARHIQSQRDKLKDS